ncbi:mucin-4 isoform X2 [Eublepharis macularius]|uniref:Mucin-4 isoform X2 n=1 Tax=Eublepharis macularius TaxID=481883 RepID=A0AA97JJN4_EUBMA|nr:mucin-4 isoform X2 [Eublepharis macularius]
MGTQQQMFWTLVGCGAWLLCNLGLAAAIPVVTSGQTTETESFPTDFLLWGTEGDYFDATTLMTTERSTIVTAPLQPTEQFASAPLGPGGISGENQGANSSSPVETETLDSELASAEGNGDPEGELHNGDLTTPGETREEATEIPMASGEAFTNANASKASLETGVAESTTVGVADGKATPAILLSEETPDPSAEAQPEATEFIKDIYSRVTDSPLPVADSEEKILESPLGEERENASSTSSPSVVEGEMPSDTVSVEATIDNGLKPTVTPWEEPQSTILVPSVGALESSTDAHSASTASAVLPDSAEEISKTSSTVSPSFAGEEKTPDAGTAETDTDNGLKPTAAPEEELTNTILGPSGGLPDSSTDAHGASAIPATLPSNLEELLPEEADATPAPGLSHSLPPENGAEEAKQTAPSELPPSGVTSLSNVETPPASVPEDATSASQSETPEGDDVPAGLDNGTAPPLSSIEETAGLESSGGKQPLVTSTGAPSQTIPSSSKAIPASPASLRDVPSGPSSSENQGGQSSLRPSPGSLSPQSGEVAESSKAGEAEGNNTPSDAASSRENSSLPLDSNAAGAQSQVPAGSPGPNQSPPVGASAVGPSASEEAKELEDSSGNSGKKPLLDAPSAESQSDVPSAAEEGTGSASSQESQPSPGGAATAGNETSKVSEDEEGSSGTRGKEMPPGLPNAESQAPGASAEEASSGLGTGGSPPSEENTSLEEADSEGSRTSPDEASTAGSRGSPGAEEPGGSSGAGALGNPGAKPQSPGTSTSETSGGLGKGGSSLSNEGEETINSGTTSSKSLQPSLDSTAAPEPAASEEAEEFDGSSKACGKETELGSPAAESGGFGDGRACHFTLAVESTRSGSAADQPSQPSADDEPVVGSGTSGGAGGSDVSSSLGGKKTPSASSAVEPQAPETSASEEVSEAFGDGRPSQLSEKEEITSSGSTGDKESQPSPDVLASTGPAASEEAEEKEVTSELGQKEKPSEAISEGLENRKPPTSTEEVNTDDSKSEGNQGSQPDEAAPSDGTEEPEGSSGVSGKETPLGAVAPESPSTGEISGGLTNGRVSNSPDEVENTGPEKEGSEGPQTSPGDASAVGSSAPEAPADSQVTDEAPENGTPLANSDAGPQSLGTSTGGNSGGLSSGRVSNASEGVENTGPEEANSERSQVSSDDATEVGSRVSKAPEEFEGTNQASANGAPLVDPDAELQSPGSSRGDTPGDLGSGRTSSSPDGVENTAPEKEGSEGPQTSPGDAAAVGSSVSDAPEQSDGTNKPNANGIPSANSNAPEIPAGTAETSVNGVSLVNSDAEPQPPGASRGDTSGDLGNEITSDSTNRVENTVPEKEGSEGPQTSPGDASAVGSSAPEVPAESQVTEEAPENGTPLANSDAEPQATPTGDNSGGLSSASDSSSPAGVENTGPEQANSEGPQVSTDEASATGPRVSPAPKESEGIGETSANGVPLSDGQPQSTGTSGGDTSGDLGNGSTSKSPNGVESTGPEKGDNEGSQTSPDDTAATDSRATNAPKIPEGTAETSANGVPLANSDGQPQPPGTSGGDTSADLGNGSTSKSPVGTGQEKADGEGPQVSPDEASGTGPRVSPAPKESEGTSETSANGVPLANSDGQSVGTSGGDTSADLGNGSTSKSPVGTGQEKADGEGPQVSPDEASGTGPRVSPAPKESEGTSETSANGVPLANSDGQSVGTSGGDTSADLGNESTSKSPVGTGQEKADGEGPQVSPDEASGTGPRVSPAPKESEGTSETSANGVPLANSDGQSVGTSGGDTSADLGNGSTSKSPVGTGQEKADGEGPQVSPDEASGTGPRVSPAPKESEGIGETSANGVPLANSDGQSVGTSGGDTSADLGNGSTSKSPVGTGQEKADGEGPQVSPDEASGTGPRVSPAPKESEGTSETSANGVPLANSDGQSVGTSGGDTSADLGNGSTSKSPVGTGQEKADGEGPQVSPDEASGTGPRVSPAPKESEGTSETSANGVPLANSDGQSVGTSGGDTSADLGNGSTSKSPVGTGQEKADGEGPQVSPDEASGTGPRVSPAPKESEGTSETSANGVPLANSDGQSVGTSGGDTSADLGNGSTSKSPVGTGQEKADGEGPQVSPDEASGTGPRVSPAPKESEGTSETSANGVPLANSDGQSVGTSGGDTSADLGNESTSKSPVGTGQEKADGEGPQVSPDEASGTGPRVSPAPKESEGTSETSANGVPLANSDGQSVGTSGGDTSADLGNGSTSKSPVGTGQEKADGEGPQVSPDEASGTGPRVSPAPKESEGIGETSANGVPLANSDGQSVGTSGGDTSADLGNGSTSKSPVGTGQEKADGEGPQVSPDEASGTGPRVSPAPKESEGTSETSANGVPLANSDGQSVGTSEGDTSADLGNGSTSKSPVGTGQEKADGEGPQVSPDEASGTGPRVSPAPKESEGTSETSANGVPLANSDGQSVGTSGGDTSVDLGNGSTSKSPVGTGQEKADGEGPPVSPDEASGTGSRVSPAPKDSEGTSETSANGVPLANSDGQSVGTSGGDTSADIGNGSTSNSPNGVENTGPEKDGSEGSQTPPDDSSAAGSKVSETPEESENNNEASENGAPSANSDAEPRSPGTSAAENPESLNNGKVSSFPDGVENSGPGKADSEVSQSSPGDASATGSKVSNAPKEPEGTNEVSPNAVPLVDSDGELQSPGKGKTSGDLGKGKSGVKGKGGKSSNLKGPEAIDAADQKSSPSTLVSSGSKTGKPGSNPDSLSPSRPSSASKSVGGEKEGKQTKAPPPGKLDARLASSRVAPEATKSTRTTNKPSDKKSGSGSRSSKNEKPAAVSVDAANSGRAGTASMSAPSVSLLPYGPNAKDKEYVERKQDFNSPRFKPEIGVPLGKTLHDSLYYTDNGQIIFPASDKDAPSYPNPPPKGFNGREQPPMIAVFWDNADFSKGSGTTFYQEYVTQKSATHPVVRDVEGKIRQYVEPSFSARWTLKITWVKAQPYPAQKQDAGTNTYQAVLTTDGYTSYVLFLYQDGGMRWDYTKLASTNVLIGYTSGDGFSKNDGLIDKTPAEKYRPDQWKGYNTDVRGLWIYKLYSRPQVNYRQRCLDWIDHENEPSVWNKDLPSCPCSLEQGVSDGRYTLSKKGVSGSRFTMLSSSTPNPYGSGVRCLYGDNNQFLEGRQERIWRDLHKKNIGNDEELKFYDWCCNRAGSQQVCDKYSQKRPKISCDGSRPPVRGTSRKEKLSSESEEERGGH